MVFVKGSLDRKPARSTEGDLAKLLVTGAVVPGTRHRPLDGTVFEDMPEETRSDWQAAPVFDQNAQPSLTQRFGSVFGRGISIEQLGQLRGLLKEADLGVGELTRDIEVIALHDRKNGQALEREVLVEIRRKAYRLVVPLEGVSDSGAYRSTSVPLGFRFNRHVE